jgi:hypothetical protein
MKLLVWHWGRRGAGPIFASHLAEALAASAATDAVFSLAAGAELLLQGKALHCDWREQTYQDAGGYVLQLLASPFHHRRILRELQAIRPDMAICAMPALLDRRMVRALQASRTPYAVIVHDASAHPGDALSFRLRSQPYLLRRAAVLFALSAHVEADLRRQGCGENGQIVMKLWHPPIFFGDMKPAFSHPGRPRLLSFGRLLPYKGLDMLADALTALGPALPFDVKICGDGPATGELARLRAGGCTGGPPLDPRGRIARSDRMVRCGGPAISGSQPIRCRGSGDRPGQAGGGNPGRRPAGTAIRPAARVALRAQCCVDRPGAAPDQSAAEADFGAKRLDRLAFYGGADARDFYG